MRKAVAVAVASGAAMMLALAGCTPSSSNGGTPSDGAVSGPLEVLYDSGYKTALEPVVASFKEQYPDVDLKVNYAGSDVLSVVSTQAQAGNLPDIFLTVPGPPGGGGFTVGTLASQGYLLDLTNEAWASEVPDTWKGAVGLDEKIYAYPGTLQGLGGIYNTTKIDELGLKIPTTWTEVIDFCKDAKKARVYAYAQGLNDAAGPQMIYLALSGTLVYGPDPDWAQQMKDGDTTFDDSGWRDIFEKYKEMNDAGCFGDGALGRDRTQGGQEVAAGNALAMVDVGAAVSGLQTQAPDSEFIQYALPATDDPSETYFPAAPGYTISANAKTENPAAVKAFLDVLAQPENINAYAGGFASVPAIPNDAYEPPANLAPFNEAIADGKFTDYSNTGFPNADVGVVAQAQVQQIFLGTQTVDGALAEMQAAFER